MQARLDGDRASIGHHEARQRARRRCSTTRLEPKLKFLDDPLTTMKFRDEIASLKFCDDPCGPTTKSKFLDDPITKSKVLDDPITKFKGFDDPLQKSRRVGPDQAAGRATRRRPGSWGVRCGRRSGDPVRARDGHHATAWQQSFPGAAAQAARQRQGS